jgi:hypothetical protein
MELPEDYYRTFFKSRYASSDTIGEMQSELKTLAQGKGAFDWFQGRPMNRQETKQTIFGGEQAPDLKNRLARAFSVKSSFLGSDEKPLGNANLNEQGKLTNNLI